MTTSRYILLRLGQAFGIRFAGHHATKAAAELHLLREAEEVLGRLCWQEIENVEDLSVEYWNLRKLDKEYEELSRRIDQAQGVLQHSHDHRAVLLEKVVDSTKDLVAAREEQIEKTERLGAEREEILREARSVKRRHDGIKAKLEVLAEEGQDETPEFEESREELEKLKRRFGALRDRRDEIAARIEELDEAIETLDEQIEERRKDMREEAFGSYQDIGKANRDISNYRAELGILDGEMSNLFAEIGRFLSLHADLPECREALGGRRGLVGQMAALRTSIHLNNRLAGRETAMAQG